MKQKYTKNKIYTRNIICQQFPNFSKEMIENK